MEILLWSPQGMVDDLGGDERLGLEQWARRLRWGGGRLTFKPGRKHVEGKGVLLLKVDL